MYKIESYKIGLEVFIALKNSDFEEWKNFP
jgi:hypothetical protein